MRWPLIVWLCLVVVLVVAAAIVWHEFGWENAGIAVVAATFAIVMGAPGAVNSLRQLGNSSSSSEQREKGGQPMVVADPSGRRFQWTSPHARVLLRTLASELPSQDDISACARASGTDLARARLAGTPDNAWQSVIEIAHESNNPAQLADLLDAASDRSAIVRSAVAAFWVGARQ